MAFTLPIRYHRFHLPDQPAPLLLRHRSPFPSPDLHLFSSGGLRLSIPAARNRRVEDVSDERRAAALADGKRDSALEIGKSEDGELSRKDGVYEGFEWKWPPWKGLPMSYKLVGTTSLAFVVCNMDKVNLSIAIIPMSHQFGWNSSTAGLVQSSFFWGYALSQLPGGWLAKLLGGRKVLEVGVLSWSLATILVPFVAGYMPGLVLSRILVGIGEGVSPSAATDLIARSIPLQERSRAVAFVFGGLSVGSVLGLLLAPSIIQNFGWESVFYIFGFLGIIWCLAFQFVKEDQSPLDGDYFDSSQMPLDTVGKNLVTIPEGMSRSSSSGELNNSVKDVPWKAFFRSQAVWAMIYTHFCGSWGHYTCLSWLPTYFGEELGLNLTGAAWVSILPSLGSILVTYFASSLADYLIVSGVETTMGCLTGKL